MVAPYSFAGFTGKPGGILLRSSTLPDALTVT
jgi:hypothetical protein